jgi:hypothetical protein
MTVKPKYHGDFGEYKIDTGSYTALNWKTPRSRDSWADKFSRMAQAKSEAEWRSVMDDETDRKAAIIHINNQNREEWLERVGEHDLHFRDIRYSEPYGGFAHEFTPTNQNDPNRITYSVIAQNSDIADKMEEAENEMQGHARHDKVGELLGFPDCCRNFFLEDWIDASIRDPMYEISCNTPSSEAVGGDNNHVIVKEPNDGTNIMWRYFGLSFITHMPCSWECQHSIDLARNRYRIMQENGYEEEADLIHDWMSQRFTWSAYHGQAMVQNAHVTSKVNSSCYLNEKKVTWKDDYEVLER